MDYESIIAGSNPAGGTCEAKVVYLGMKTFKYVVMLQVEVEAFTDEDGKDCLLDTFGPGEDGGILITDVTIKDAK